VEISSIENVQVKIFILHFYSRELDLQNVFDTEN